VQDGCRNGSHYWDRHWRRNRLDRALGLLLLSIISNHGAVAFDKVRKERLKTLLSGERYTWRSMEVLSSSIGADEETNAALLIETDARKSVADGRNNWALVSREPFPDDGPD
jgi:hypothetical protein